MGYVHPNRMLEELSGSELTDWMAYGLEEPFSPAETIITAILKGFSKKKTGFGVGEQQTVEEQKAALEGLLFAVKDGGMGIRFKKKREDG